MWFSSRTPEPLPSDYTFVTGAGIVCLSQHLDRIRLPFRGPGEVDLVVHPLLSTAAWMRARLLGLEVFHAGAVLTCRGAWLLLGDKEAGKSTLLAQLHAKGLPVVADDLSILDAGRVYSGPRCLDLRPDMAQALGMGRSVRRAERCRVDLPPVAAEHRVAGFVELRWSERWGVTAVEPCERLPLLLDASGRRPRARPPRDARAGDPAVLPGRTPAAHQRRRGAFVGGRVRGGFSRAGHGASVIPEAAVKQAKEMGADVVIWQAQPMGRGPDRWLRNLALAAHGVTLGSSSMHAPSGDNVIATVCDYCRHPDHGKPHLVDQVGCFFNVSYAADLSVCAVGTGEVGIDVTETSRLEALDVDAIDAATRGAIGCAVRVLPDGADPKVGWTVFEAIAKGLGLGLAAQGDHIAAALRSWSITLYQPTATTVACLATTIAHPVVVRATVEPSTRDVIVADTVVADVEAGGQRGGGA